DPACGSNFAGLGFGTGALSCTNYSIMGDGTNTYVNAPSNVGQLNLRIANQDYMTLEPDPLLGIPTTITFANSIFGAPIVIGSGIENILSFVKVDDNFNKGFGVALSATSNLLGGTGILGEQASDSGGIGVMGLNQNAQNPIAIAAVAGTNSSVGDIGVMSETSGLFTTSMWGLAGSGTGILAENTGSQITDSALVAFNDFANPLASVFVVLGSGSNASCNIDVFGDLA